MYCNNIYTCYIIQYILYIYIYIYIYICIYIYIIYLYAYLYIYMYIRISQEMTGSYKKSNALVVILLLTLDKVQG